MKTRIIILTLTIIGCGNLYAQNITDTLTGLFNKALSSDTVEFIEFTDDYFELFYFKSGYTISKAEKNALVITCSNDKTYIVKLYSNQNDKWNLIDSINISDSNAYSVQFDVIFDDYNFDKQTDIYIQASASNGWSLSRGHLIIINSQTKKLELHKEARELANMKPDKKSKTVKSELWNGYDIMDRAQLTIFTHKWINGQLKTTSKKDITIK